MQEGKQNWAPVLHDYKRLLYIVAHLLAAILYAKTDTDDLLKKYHACWQRYGEFLYHYRDYRLLKDQSPIFDDRNWDCVSIRSEFLLAHPEKSSDVEDCPDQ